MACSHANCGSKEKVWLPFESNGLSSGLKPHPYCIHCGHIKNISSDKAKNIGYYINILSELGHKSNDFTNVQKRLIIKELEIINDFEDTYSMTLSSQNIIFMKILKKYCNLPKKHLISIIE